MEVSGMDGTDLRLMFVLGLGVLTLAIAVLARAVEWLVAGWRAYRLTAVETATRHASVAAFFERRELSDASRLRIVLTRRERRWMAAGTNRRNDAREAIALPSLSSRPMVERAS
jgi:hypothetical protein